MDTEPTESERDLLADHFKDMLLAGRRIAHLEAENAALRKLVRGQSKLLVAYRLGTRRTPEAAFRLLDEAERELAALGITRDELGA